MNFFKMNPGSLIVFFLSKSKRHRIRELSYCRFTNEVTLKHKNTPNNKTTTMSTFDITTVDFSKPTSTDDIINDYVEQVARSTRPYVQAVSYLAKTTLGLEDTKVNQLKDFLDEAAAEAIKGNIFRPELVPESIGLHIGGDVDLLKIITDLRLNLTTAQQSAAKLQGDVNRLQPEADKVLTLEAQVAQLRQEVALIKAEKTVSDQTIQSLNDAAAKATQRITELESKVPKQLPGHVYADVNKPKEIAVINALGLEGKPATGLVPNDWANKDVIFTAYAHYMKGGVRDATSESKATFGTAYNVIAAIVKNATK